MNDPELTARLQEDGATEVETAVLLPLLRQLTEPPALPLPAETETLLASLLPELPAPPSPSTWRDTPHNPGCGYC